MRYRHFLLLLKLNYMDLPATAKQTLFSVHSSENMKPNCLKLPQLFLFCRSEEPALTNMDISTGHMVLVSCFQINFNHSLGHACIQLLCIAFMIFDTYLVFCHRLTWKTTSAIRTAWSRSGGPSARTRQSPAPPPPP